MFLPLIFLPYKDMNKRSIVYLTLTLACLGVVVFLQKHQARWWAVMGLLIATTLFGYVTWSALEVADEKYLSSEEEDQEEAERYAYDQENSAYDTGGANDELA